MIQFSTTQLPVTTPVVDRLELLNAQEELHQVWSDLTEAQKSMTEVQEIMENLQTSIDALTKYGQAAVEQLNVDGSLEALLRVPAKLITVEKAQEGLVDAVKSGFNKFIEFVKWIWQKICGAFNAVLEIFGLRKKKVEEVTAQFKALPAPQKTLLLEMKPNLLTASQENLSVLGQMTKKILPYDQLKKFLESEENTTKELIQISMSLEPTLREMIDTVSRAGALSGSTDINVSDHLDDMWTKMQKELVDSLADDPNPFYKVTYDADTNSLSLQWLYKDTSDSKTFAELGYRSESEFDELAGKIFFIQNAREGNKNLITRIKDDSLKAIEKINRELDGVKNMTQIKSVQLGIRAFQVIVSAATIEIPAELDKIIDYHYSTFQKCMNKLREK